MIQEKIAYCKRCGKTTKHVVEFTTPANAAAMSLTPYGWGLSGMAQTKTTTCTECGEKH